MLLRGHQTLGGCLGQETLCFLWPAGCHWDIQETEIRVSTSSSIFESRSCTSGKSRVRTMWVFMVGSWGRKGVGMRIQRQWLKPSCRQDKRFINMATRSVAGGLRKVSTLPEIYSERVWGQGRSSHCNEDGLVNMWSVLPNEEKEQNICDSGVTFSVFWEWDLDNGKPMQPNSCQTTFNLGSAGSPRTFLLCSQPSLLQKARVLWHSEHCFGILREAGGGLNLTTKRAGTETNWLEQFVCGCEKEGEVSDCWLFTDYSTCLPQVPKAQSLLSMCPSLCIRKQL